MAVLKVNELPRQNQFRFGDARRLQRRWIVTVDDPSATTGSQYSVAIGVDLGTAHPEYSYSKCVEVDINEGYEESPYHTEIIATYGVDDDILDNPNPLLRPDQWTFETQGVAVPALFYFDDSDNRLPLTNSAYDYFEGLTTDEAQTRVRIEGNRPSFPMQEARALTNRINSTSWLGADPYTWKCQGITGEQRREIVADQVVTYWRYTTTLMYRQSGWVLQIPDMGFNALVGGQKRRVMTFDQENAEWIPSPVPMGLDGNGNQTFGAPAILPRRTFLTANFNVYFGTPPR